MLVFLYYIGAALLLMIPGAFITDYFNFWGLL